MLALVVATINGFSGIGYIVGGEFEISMEAAAGNETKNDPRWQSQQNSTETTMSPRDEMATLSLLLESKFGRFGLFLQVVCLIQFIGGLLVVFRSTAGAAELTFLILIAIAGVLAEFIGAQYSSDWGITNILGLIVSIMLVPVVFNMYKTTRGIDET